MPDHFPALTVRQPWNWAALAPIPAPKRAENRGRRIGYRGPLWWHAGARSRWDAEGASSHIIGKAWEQYLRTVPDWPGLPAADVTVLPEPVPCRGALGLWRLTDEVEQAARGQLEAVR